MCTGLGCPAAGCRGKGVWGSMRLAPLRKSSTMGSGTLCLRVVASLRPHMKTAPVVEDGGARVVELDGAWCQWGTMGG